MVALTRRYASRVRAASDVDESDVDEKAFPLRPPTAAVTPG